MLCFPRMSHKILGFPRQLPECDAIVFGLLATMWLAVGLVCLDAIRKPFRYLVLLRIQLLYKTIWLLVVALPMWCRASLPDYGWTLLLGNAAWVVLDIAAIPWFPVEESQGEA